MLGFESRVEAICCPRSGRIVVWEPETFTFLGFTHSGHSSAAHDCSPRGAGVRTPTSIRVGVGKLAGRERIQGRGGIGRSYHVSASHLFIAAQFCT